LTEKASPAGMIITDSFHFPQCSIFPVRQMVGETPNWEVLLGFCLALVRWHWVKRGVAERLRK
jgi:hypothetical protein